jgi:ATP-binding cassette subfamily B protein
VNEDAYSKAFDRVLFARILAYVRPYRLQVALALLFLLLATLTAAATPLFFKWAIDGALVPKEEKPLAERFALLLLVSPRGLGLGVLPLGASMLPNFC